MAVADLGPLSEVCEDRIHYAYIQTQSYPFFPSLIDFQNLNDDYFSYLIELNYCSRESCHG